MHGDRGELLPTWSCAEGGTEASAGDPCSTRGQKPCKETKERQRCLSSNPLKSTQIAQESFSRSQDLIFPEIAVFPWAIHRLSATLIFSFLKPPVAKGTCSFLCQLSWSHCFF